MDNKTRAIFLGFIICIIGLTITSASLTTIINILVNEVKGDPLLYNYYYLAGYITLAYFGIVINITGIIVIILGFIRK